MHSTTPTTIHLSWTSSGTVVDNYEVSWKRNKDEKCPAIDMHNSTITVSPDSYTITGLEEDSSYTITVTAINAAGKVFSVLVTGVTMEAGKGQVFVVIK